jgi:tRNA(Ile)-lysidine synthase
VDEFLEANRMPTAPGSIMVSIPPLMEITSPIVRQALVLRILRYVSYEPWGSIRSEVKRRQKSVNRLVKVLWDRQGLRFRKNISFSVGSGVWWKPAFVTKGHVLKTVVKELPFQSIMWFAHRHPSVNSPTAPVSDELRIVMTYQLREGRMAWEAKEGPDKLEVLFDRRFLIKFRLDKMPEDLFEALKTNGGVVIKKRSPWHLPEVDFKQNKVYTVIHTLIQREKFTWVREWGTKTYIDTESDWITIQYIRPISSI